VLVWRSKDNNVIATIKKQRTLCYRQFRRSPDLLPSHRLADHTRLKLLSCNLMGDGETRSYVGNTLATITCEQENVLE
jgi:hypothetical protein